MRPSDEITTHNRQSGVIVQVTGAGNKTGENHTGNNAGNNAGNNK